MDKLQEELLKVSPDMEAYIKSREKARAIHFFSWVIRQKVSPFINGATPEEVYEKYLSFNRTFYPKGS